MDITYPIAAVSAVLLAVSLYVLYARPSKAAAKVVTVAEVVDERPVVRLLYGTQTGTAEKFSKQLAAKLTESYGEATRFLAMDVEHYKHEELLSSEVLMFFLLATYGDGEPTDNAMAMYDWITKTSEDVMNGDQPEIMKGSHYAVFGLGNKQYEHFNSVGKHVHKHLQVLGGTPIVPVGLGDDDADLADDFEVWCDKLMAALATSTLLTKSTLHTAAVQRQGYDVELLPGGTATVSSTASMTWTPSGNALHVPQLGRIEANRELHTSHSDRSCLHVELDISGTGTSYQHGDHVAILPQNSSETVDLACQQLGVAADTVLRLQIPVGNSEQLNDPFPCPVTLRTALAHHTELLQHPDKQALEALATCCSSEDEAARLKHLASHDGKAEYATYIVAAKRSLLQVLADHPSCRPPLGLFFAHIAPPLQPRYYSISSSPLRHPACVHVTAALVNEVVSSGRRHLGVTTHWLSQRKPGDVVPFFIRNSTFKLPSDASRPVVMIGPGTGLAPFRGFVQERGAQKLCGDAVGPATLFFGCRHPEQDYIYQEELEASSQDQVLTSLFVAFSRLASKKDYVQHHVLVQAAAVYQALEANGLFYVCGDAKHMAKDVHRALHDVIQASRKCSTSEAEAYVKALQTSGRYMQDVW